MRVWVTGAAGFVGRLFVARLDADGHTVLGVDRELEITAGALVARRVALARPDAIVHLAALSSGSLSLQEPELTARVNYFGTRCVLEAARREAPAARILLVSSGEVYGSGAPGSAPFTEADPLLPRTPYARSKACADLLGTCYAARGLDVVRVRPFNHIGPGQSDLFVASSFARQLAEIARGVREPRLRVGELDSVRDFLDVEDVIDAYMLLLDRLHPPGVYNVASGVGRRIGDLLDTLIELAGVSCEVEIARERVRPADYAVGDASRLRAVTGWEPRIPFRESLRRVLSAAGGAAAA